MFVVITATVLVAIIMYFLLQHVEYNFQFKSTVEADFEALYNYWNDLSNLEKVHPYMKSVKLLSETTEGKYTVSSYDIHEKVPYLPLVVPYDKYTTKKYREGQTCHLNMVGSVLKGGFQLESDITISEAGTKLVKVEQTSKVKVLRLLAFLLLPQYTEAQEAVQANVKKHLEKSQ